MPKFSNKKKTQIILKNGIDSTLYEKFKETCQKQNKHILPELEFVIIKALENYIEENKT